MFRTEPLAALGEGLKQGVPEKVMQQALTDNPVFTEESILFAIEAITSELLDKEKLEEWINRYPPKEIKGEKIALIMAGNIPLVGISDLICVVALGGTPLIKPSSKDRALMGWVVEVLKENGVDTEPLNDNSVPDAVIATGSDASTTVFKQKYGHLPLLTRGTRTSAAIITGDTTANDLRKLWTDAFMHSSLGCRNISHLLLKNGTDITSVANIWGTIPFGNKFILNNYRQKKALSEMSGQIFTDCGYVIFRESDKLDASLGEITYSYYKDNEQLQAFLSANRDRLQCIVGEGYVPFGQAQRPTLYDWADGVDTIDFLIGAVYRTR